LIPEMRAAAGTVLCLGLQEGDSPQLQTFGSCCCCTIYLLKVVVALLVALLAVRALGQTDLNPVSGVGKISQVRPHYNMLHNAITT
jgi:hypothetical protein